MKVLAVHVGQPGLVRWRGEQVRTAIFKRTVPGPVLVGPRGLDGDRQADPAVHGGQEKAVYAYSAEHYADWRRERPDLDLPYGRFGENITVEGLAQPPVCVGDSFRIGTAELTVTGPRLPCYKLGIAVGSDAFVREFRRSGRPGFYLAVVRGGAVQQGDDILVLGRHPARLSVGEMAWLVGRGRTDQVRLRKALAVDALPTSWYELFTTLLERPPQDRHRT